MHVLQFAIFNVCYTHSMEQPHTQQCQFHCYHLLASRWLQTVNKLTGVLYGYIATRFRLEQEGMSFMIVVRD